MINFLELLDLLSDEEGNRDDAEKDGADFLLTKHKSEIYEY